MHNFFTSASSSKEIHSADGSCFIAGERGGWAVYFLGERLGVLQKRENARRVIRLCKGR